MNKLLTEIFASIGGIVLFVALFHAKNYATNFIYAKQRSYLADLVSFCIKEEVERRTKIEDIILQEQAAFNLRSDLLIHPDEYDIFFEILSAYQKDLSDRFYNNELPFKKEFSKLTRKQYFWYSLEVYLSKHLSNRYFGEMKKYQVIERIEYSPLSYDETVEFTQYGLVWYKLLHLSRLTLRNSGIKHFTEYLQDWNEKTSEENIAQKKTTFSTK